MEPVERLTFSDSATALLGAEGPTGAVREFDEQRPLFQWFNGWIVTATTNGLVLVDQHRAHTRILYEQFSSRGAQASQGAQQLLFPAELNLGPADTALLMGSADELVALGFDLDASADGFVLVRGLPPEASERDAGALLDAILSELREAGEVESEWRASRARAGLAKGAAIPSGRTLTRTEMLDLVDGLFACQEPDRDPWGRPTIATFDREAIAARFR